ncbi:MAG: heme ABC exporter ATP-binding protein CcmA [Dehalococcoidia bacterium]
MYALQVEKLSKYFGPYTALKAIDLELREGEFVSVLGPNGAGKTTLIKVVATISRPSKGEIYIQGHNINRNGRGARSNIGMVGHQSFLYDHLTAYENLRFTGKMYGIRHLEDRINEVIEQVGLRKRLHDRVGILSRGMQQRLSIARAVLHDPPIMLLDEPETGLDQQSVSMLNEMLKGFASGKRTMLMTTHNLDQALDLSDRVIILHKGRITGEEYRQSLNIEALRDKYHLCTGASY